MGITLDGLDGGFKTKLQKTLNTCAQRGVIMTPYFGIRTPQEQGKLWRQSRTSADIQAKLADLRAAGAHFLADCIDHAGPQNGPNVTGAIPGLSWHQWGEAMDCFWRLDDKAEWSTTRGGAANGYRIYAAVAVETGLTAGGLWSSLKDWPHVQLRKAGSPLQVGITLQAVDARMKATFG
ncbi:hypothetical protein BH10PSE3_BH10PSE3_36880 [soil metagenome]